MLQIPGIDMEKTGQNITRLRRQAGLSVRQLQKLCGFSSPQAIYKWQAGQSLPSIDNLLILSSVFHCRIDDILIRRQ